MFGSFVCIGLAVLFVAIWFRVRQRAQRTETWSSVTGTVNESRAVLSSDPEAAGDALVLTYTYVAAGRSFQGHEVSMGGISNVRKTAAKYTAGTQVIVYYDPQEPQSAVLERGSSGSWMWLAFAAGALVIALGFAGGK